MSDGRGVCRTTGAKERLLAVIMCITCVVGMKIGFAQLNTTVGDLRGNCEKIAGAYDRLNAGGADLVLTPELAITGYPPQDLVFKSRFVPETLEKLDQLHAHVRRGPARRFC
jgi:NAD+ synthase (glutamine-hydrolysing)